MNHPVSADTAGGGRAAAGAAAKRDTGPWRRVKVLLGFMPWDGSAKRFGRSTAS